MRQIAFLLGLAAMALATPTLSEPRKISGINARTIVSDGQIAYVDNGAMIYRLQRTDEGVRKLDSIGYEGNASEAALYIPRGLKTGFLVFKDSVCSVNWDWIKEDRMMCTGGVSLGWGDYTGGVTMGKLSVCGGSGAYVFNISSSKPMLLDSMGGTDRKTCEVLNADQIEVRRGTDVMNFYRCLTVSECGDAPAVSVPTNRFYTRNRFASNGANTVVIDSLGRLGLWYSPATDNVRPIEGYQPSPNKSAYLAASNLGNKALAAVGFDSMLVFGRRVDLGLEQYSKLSFDAAVGLMDLDKDVLWLQVGRDIVSFDVKESISSLVAAPSIQTSALKRNGRTLEITPMAGGTEIRIQRADGRLEAQFQSGSGSVRWTAPGPGLRIVKVGRTTETVVIP
ncbi:MAG: hypothetical protein IPN71_21215 [Fibrobacteres bacterium]|nr:hypothetical protein [Fibrobacterota bacterium]